MNTRTIRIVVGITAAIALPVASGLAAYYSHRAAYARAQWLQASHEVEALRQKLLLQQPHAADIVFASTSAAPKPVSGEPVASNDLASASQAERIRALEAALQARDRQLAAQQDRSTNRPALVFQPGSDRGSWMEDLKRTDPERYKELVKRREEQHKAVNDAFAQKAAKLLEGGVADTTQAEQAERALMLQLVSETWKMAEQLYADPPPANRRAVMHDMHANLDTLRPMLASERNRMFYQLGLESGYTPQDSKVFVDYVNQVIETTSIQPLSRAMHHGSGWGGGQGGPPVPVGPKPASGTAPH